MFERFTDRARRVVVLAQEEARRLCHNYIGTEHVLLGLLHEGDGMAAHALRSVGLTLADVRREVSEMIGTGQNPPAGHIPFTPRTKKVLELSLREALKLGAEYIGTEHLLLGLVREGEGVGAQILIRLAGGLDVVRAAVIELYERRPADPLEDEARLSGEPVAPATGMTAGERRVPRRYLTGSVAGSPAGQQSGEQGPVVRMLRGAEDPVVQRPVVTELLLSVLGRRRNNSALIIGPLGAGKSALARVIHRMIIEGAVQEALRGGEVMEVSLQTLRTGAEYLARRHVRSVLLVEDLDTLLAADAFSNGRMALGLAALADADAPLMVTATAEGVARLRRDYPSLAARFDEVRLAEADAEFTLTVLRELRPLLQDFHGVVIEDAALATAVEYGTRFVPGRVLPGAAVDLLDLAAARVSALRPQAGTAVVGAAEIRSARSGADGGDGDGNGDGGGDPPGDAQNAA